MTRYEIMIEKTIFQKLIVDGEDKAEAIEKGFAGEVVEQISSEFLFPSTDWAVKEIKEVKND